MNSLGGPLYQDICPSLHVHICLFLSEKHERPGPDLVVGVGGGRPGVGGEEPQEESPQQEHGHGPGMSHEPHLTSHTDLVQPECV